MEFSSAAEVLPCLFFILTFINSFILVAFFQANVFYLMLAVTVVLWKPIFTKKRKEKMKRKTL